MSASRLSDYSYRGILLANAAPGALPIPSRDLVGRIGGANSVTGVSAWPELLTWGRPLFSSENGSNILYAGAAPRMGGRDMSPVEVQQTIERGDGIPEAILPPLWAMRSNHRRTEAYTDCLGFGHLYYRELTDRVVLSTSARALGLTGTGGLCDEALAVQSLVGWQLGERTMFAGVNKIRAGERISVREGRLEAAGTAPPEAVITSSQPDIDCARLLRDFMNSYLDDHPDAELQLTGGLDSRILLAAIPPARRSDVAVMTLAVPSATEDVGLASRIAQQYGMPHRILHMSGLAELSPAEAFELTLTAARRLDSAADPIALAAVDFAELSADPRPRIAGLGGEVLRGFYYFGQVRHTPVTRNQVERLARWRIMANEAAPRQMFDDGFAAWASNFVLDDLYREFKATGAPWSLATDHFYLRQRMHRWAGVLASASAMDRTIVNPMLDSEILAIARGVAPEQKKNARFLSQILLRLDEDLARIPLDARPAPVHYSSRSPRSRALIGGTTARKFLRKAAQRLSNERRSPEGGEILSSLVLRHLRENPSVLDPVLELGHLNQSWIDEMLSGDHPIEPSAVGMLVGLIATRPATT